MQEMELNLVAGGALQEKFNQALQKVLANMQDPNTSAGGKREVTIKLKFDQNEERDNVRCEIAVSTKLASVRPVSTQFGVFNNLQTGQIDFEEYGAQILGQTSMSDSNITKMRKKA